MKPHPVKPSPTATILIVDDHPIVRAGIAGRLSRDARFIICGEAETANEAVAVSTERQPDVILLDISLKDGCGLGLIKQLKRCSPASRIIVVSMYEDVPQIQRALSEGADGYVCKREAAESLVTAVEVVLRGELFVSSGLDNGTAQDVGGPRRFSFEQLQDLTPREMQTLWLIGEGKSGKEIAEAMGISVKTVDTYRSNLRLKLGIHDPRKLVQSATVWVRSQQTRGS
jgi:DNA-binding NarL/FixJ family response regulator